MDVLRLPVALDQVATEVSADRLIDVFQPDRWASVKTGWRYFVTKTSGRAAGKHSVYLCEGHLSVPWTKYGVWYAA